MDKSKRVKKAAKPRRRAVLSISAVAEEWPEAKPKRRYISLRDVLKNYKPRKEAVTLRLDADVVAWFKRPGRGYQTRINGALRKLVMEEKKEEGE
jgi:uncharacterized protein (DUF4415 family)